MAVGTVGSIHTYPVKGAPGTDLTDVVIGPDGLEGDRRKGAPVHLVATTLAAGIRANLLLDVEPADLPSPGGVVSVGSVELVVTGPAKNCPGMYADVRTPGSVAVGDPVAVADAPAAVAATPVDPHANQGR